MAKDKEDYHGLKMNTNINLVEQRNTKEAVINQDGMRIVGFGWSGFRKMLND